MAMTMLQAALTFFADGRIEQGYIYDLADTKPKDREELMSN